MVVRMDTTLAHRVTAEVRAEASRQRLSQSALARAAGMSVPSTRRYFYTDEREPTLSSLVAVSAALGVSVPELFRRADRARPVEVVDADADAEEPDPPEFTAPAARPHQGAVPPATFQPPRPE